MSLEFWFISFLNPLFVSIDRAGMAGSVVIRDGRFADFVAGLQVRVRFRLSFATLIQRGIWSIRRWFNLQEALRDNDGGGSGSGGGVIDQIEEAVKKVVACTFASVISMPLRGV